MASADRPLPIRLAIRLLTAVVAIVGFEIVGLGLYLAALKPYLLDTILGGPSDFQLKMIVAGNGDLLLIGSMLAVAGLAFAFRSETPEPTSAPESTSASESTGRSSQSTPGSSDEDGGFAFGDGE